MLAEAIQKLVDLLPRIVALVENASAKDAQITALTAQVADLQTQLDAANANAAPPEQVAALNTAVTNLDNAVPR